MPAIEARGLYKRFQATRALEDVSFAVEPGEIHALVGENGAGKSTLIKILGGVYRPDRGIVAVAGEKRRFAGPREALAGGIVTIPQEMRVVPALGVAENVLIGHLPMRRALGLPVLDRAAMARRAAGILDRLGIDLDPGARVDRLGYAERQLVMIARALSHAARVVILDEPTAALEAREVERLFRVIDALKADGVAIVYVSHRLDEVEALADTCTVLRDGRAVERFARGERGRADIVRAMTGRDIETAHAAPGAASTGILLRGPVGGEPEVAVGEGRVLGLAGLLGSGTTELLHRLFGGVRRPVEIEKSGAPVRLGRPADAIRAGIGLVPGERALGLAMELTVRENIVLPNLPLLARGLRLDRPAIDRLVARLIESVDIRPPDPDRSVRQLSGGNQQKVIFARWLAGHADVLLLDEPTHGIDIGAKAQVHRLMQRFVEDGGGIVMASSEMAELLALSDSVLAMRRGTAVGRLTRDGEYTEAALRSALGG
ncbi:MAG: sugar ABC transporter ATP-binding protein [Defluviicoccus sp.]|nr:sugar ABC transporter ATP-binding protein [Defluviicoccus sp.]MDE0383439.1 sugar ABC transporter ATP-binding protein [Defluviicoccus sp.]